ncbi:dedicator of cytokinesis protein 1 isoform X1 [Anopheles funestus]|uniref:dedicator of cytokinesis protein 1 isoform X1 n=1 Tax=Anopheles funestus TaxID=62324 RepID=UPI0020C73A94|nr:dedicator of cytokinesis protein 1 isoform X1 [Anopheles funestus]
MTVWSRVPSVFLAVAKANYAAHERQHHIDLDVGDTVVIEQESFHWYYGRNSSSGTLGIFPKAYVHPVESKSSRDGDLVIRRSEIVEEITTVLQEWQYLYRRLYLSTHPSFKLVQVKMLELIRLRSQLLSGNLPVDEMKNIKLKATSEIDTGNKILNLDMVVRDDSGNIVDIERTSTTQLYEHHLNAVDRIKRANTSHSKNRNLDIINRHSHNLLLSVHNFVCRLSEDTEILFTLYDGDEMRAITENYVVKWSRQGMAADLDQFNNIKVLFTDLSGNDLSRNKIYLVAYVVRIGAMDGKDTDLRRSSMANSSNSGSYKSHRNHLNTQMSTPSSPGPGSGGGSAAGQSNSGTPSIGSTISASSVNEFHMRRPFGVATLDLQPIIKRSEDFKSDTQLKMPFIPCEKEPLETTLRKLITNKDLGEKSDAAIWISVDILFGDIKQVRDEYPHLVLGNVAFARKMGFPEVIFPGDVRNDLYLTLVSGEFSKGSKSSDKNIEVTAYVCNKHGVAIPGVISYGGGGNALNEYKSVIYYHEDRPKWGETFKIDVPIEEFKQCHLRFTFKHRSSNEAKDRSEKPFGLSYVRLMNDDGTTLQHKRHTLLVYKIDHKKYDEETQFNYLNLPSLTEELPNGSSKPSISGFSLASKDGFIIETNLCSTKLTQNVDILGLLNWSSRKEKMEESLNALMNVRCEEVVKFLQDILDALFNILVSNDDPAKYDNLVFKCLLRLIEIVYDLKYQHFQSVLDLYINESFSATLAYEKLINVVQTHIRNAINNISKDRAMANIYTVNENDEALYRTTKYLQYIMKFIIRSRLLFADLNQDKDRELFVASLEELLESFSELIKYQNDLLKSQGALLKYLHIIASDLMQVYDPVKLSQKIVDIITNVPTGRLNQSKMTCIKDVVDSKLFKLPKCRAILLPVFCRQIKDKLESKEEGDFMFDIRQQEKNLTKAAKVLGESKSQLHTRETTAKTKVAECVNIMNNMLELLFQSEEDIGPVDNDIRDIMLILLRTVIQSSIAMDRSNPLVGNLVAIMLGVFRSMTETHYQCYVRSFLTSYDLLDFLTEILLVFQELVSKPVFPMDWLDMIMHQNMLILGSLQHFAAIIMDQFFSPFEKQVWSNYFQCSITFLTQPALQLNLFSKTKQSVIRSNYRDIRRETVFEIRKMWFNLGEHKIMFVPRLVGPILEMSMIPEEDLRRATIPIFFDMMQCEYYSSKYAMESYGDTKRNTAHIKGNFNDFEKEIIEKLDHYIEGGYGDAEYKDLFYEIMHESCSNHSTLQTYGVQCVQILTRLMEKLLEYRCLIHDESKENRMACTVSLLQFYSDVNRKEMYIRYVDKLYELHMEFDNFTEAAYTLKLHSNELNWDETPLSLLLKSKRHYSCSTHRTLKEQLYRSMIDLFDKGKMWECAIDLCKELAQQYENEVYDYLSLSEQYKKMSLFYESILRTTRYESIYYRVTFYGTGFPEFLRNKEFVYRGNEYEDAGSFNMRILSQHPRAELLTTLTPGSEILECDGQFIQIVKVDPVSRDIRFGGKNTQTIASNIVKFYKSNNVSEFQFSRPIRDSQASGDDIAGTSYERTIMRTTDPLPGILRWFPVKFSETIMISPIEMAIETVDAKNRAIRDLVLEHQNDPRIPVHSLSAIIKGVVDAAINGGLPIYEEAFLTPLYLERRPGDDHLVARLKDLIASQIPLLEVALLLHKMKTPAILLPFHDQLEKCFATMQANVEAKYGKRVTDIKIDRDAEVTLRRHISANQPQMSMDSSRLSETSIGSSDSGISKNQNSRPTTTSSGGFKNTIANLANFNTVNLASDFFEFDRISLSSFTANGSGGKLISNLSSKIGTKLRQTSLGTSPGSKAKKDKTLTKRRSSRKMDRESLSLSVSNSQFYTSPISTASEHSSSIVSSDRDSGGPISLLSTSTVTAVSNATTPTNSLPVFELTEELHPKRPLRSEVEKEKRLSRPPSIATPTMGSRSLPGVGTASNGTTTGDTNSIGSAESSSNRNSIITNGSTTSEEDSVPPPLPLKTRTDADYTNLPCGGKGTNEQRQYTAPAAHIQQPSNASHYITFKPLLATGTTVVAVNASYDVVETRNHSVIVINSSSSSVTGCSSPPPGSGGVYDDRKRPPTPPPKPARNSKV